MDELLREFSPGQEGMQSNTIGEVRLESEFGQHRKGYLAYAAQEKGCDSP